MTVYKTTALTYVAQKGPLGWSFSDTIPTDMHVEDDGSDITIRYFLPNDLDHAVTRLDRAQCAELIVALHRALHDSEHPKNKGLTADRIRAAAKKALT